MSGPVIRAMTLEDIPAVAQIERESFATPWSPDAFYTELTKNLFAHYFVLEQDEQVVGYAGMWVLLDEAHVTNIALREAFRGRGLGERLLREMMAVAWQRGAKRMTLEVRVSNERAQRLYRKLGFEPSGVRPGYYTDNGEDALIMWADLPAPGEPSAGDARGGPERVNAAGERAAENARTDGERNGGSGAGHAGGSGAGQAG